MNKKKILLFGPGVPDSKLSGAYGGGLGGYTRNMLTYLKYFRSNDFAFVPCYHTIRSNSKWTTLIQRFFIDLRRFLLKMMEHEIFIVHVLAQYRGAIPREFAVCVLSKVMRKHVVYEIKAGVFDSWYRTTNYFSQFMLRYILRNSAVILSEGERYVEFISHEFGLLSHYFPNYVAWDEVPSNFQPKEFNEGALNILFVGYCYEGKGVYELVEACLLYGRQEGPVKLTLVGAESKDFANWLQGKNLKEVPNFQLVRVGMVPPNEVGNYFEDALIYCYPSKHLGEGHNNTINEAMMFGLIILTSRAGFIGDILNEGSAYLIDTVDVKCIYNQLKKISKDTDRAISKAREARRIFLERFTSKDAFRKLEFHYRSCV